MCLVLALGATAASGVYSAYSSIQSGNAQSKMYEYQADQLNQQKTLAQQTADLNSKLNQDTASQQGKQLMNQTKELYGSQKATLAAQGVGGGSVTAEDIMSNTFNKAKLDQIALRYNADVKSWEYQNEAKNQIWGLTNQQNYLNTAAKNAKKAGYSNATSTLLMTAASMAATGLLAGAGASTAASTSNTASSGFKLGTLAQRATSLGLLP